eukprot:2343806-Rhodomonas_salina.2
MGMRRAVLRYAMVLPSSHTMSDTEIGYGVSIISIQDPAMVSCNVRNWDRLWCFYHFNTISGTDRLWCCAEFCTQDNYVKEAIRHPPYLPMQRPVLTYHLLLTTPSLSSYALCGTDLSYAATNTFPSAYARALRWAVNTSRPKSITRKRHFNTMRTGNTGTWPVDVRSWLGFAGSLTRAVRAQVVKEQRDSTIAQKKIDDAMLVPTPYRPENLDPGP